MQGDYKKVSQTSYASGFSMGQRPRVSSVPDDKRGPGAYLSIWDNSQGPSYTFSGKGTPERKKDRDGPGPGEYCSTFGYFSTKSSAPAYTMGARCGPAAFQASSCTPETSNYSTSGTRVRDSSVAYTIAHQSTQNSTLGPGPGSYNICPIPGGPSYSMGLKSVSRGIDRSDLPGPGSYNVTRKPSGPSFSIAPKIRLQACQRDSNPGPGAYSNIYYPVSRGMHYRKSSQK